MHYDKDHDKVCDGFRDFNVLQVVADGFLADHVKSFLKVVKTEKHRTILLNQLFNNHSNYADQQRFALKSCSCQKLFLIVEDPLKDQ